MNYWCEACGHRAGPMFLVNGHEMHLCWSHACRYVGVLVNRMCGRMVQ